MAKPPDQVNGKHLPEYFMPECLDRASRVMIGEYATNLLESGYAQRASAALRRARR
jgi:hypothetical protein